LAPERSAWLAGLPILATALFYLLPSEWQNLRAVQFLPQAAAYAALAAWAARNRDITARLGLRPAQIGRGWRWGLITGLALGAANTGIILWAVPWLGHDIAFLHETPHAQMPVAVMIPWCILLIALFVEINFRGFLLGRLLTLLSGLPAPVAASIAIATSALAFSFDPFMTATFRHLHWIAVWDGVTWGLLWVRLRNLYAPIVAHAVEVMVLYSVIRTVLS
jgi:membrane protease YdiL (CAAX protease family)